MKKKLNRLAGFTLAELLIVVAIIGVLVAISIPIFTSRLEASRESTDAANLRSAYAAGMTALLTGKAEDGTAITDYSADFYYSRSGKLTKTADDAMTGKSTQTGYQGEDMDDLPDGVYFGYYTSGLTEATPHANSSGAGYSANGKIHIKLNNSTDKIYVFFGT